MYVCFLCVGMSEFTQKEKWRPKALNYFERSKARFNSQELIIILFGLTANNILLLYANMYRVLMTCQVMF